MSLFKVCDEPLTFEEYVRRDVGTETQSNIEYADAIVNQCAADIAAMDAGSTIIYWNPDCNDYDSWVDEYNRYIESSPCEINYLGVGLVLALGVGAIYLIRRKK